MIQPEQLTDGVTLYCGDALDVLPRLSGISAVISDPPYGMDWDTDTTRFSGGRNPARRGAGRNDGKRIHGDNQSFDPTPWLEFPRVALFGANHYAHRLPVGTWLVWVKRNDDAYGSFLSDAELVWVKGGYGVYCHRDLSMNALAGERAHPSQKPVPLMRWVIRKATKPDDVILDPYAGSGSTAEAAMREGRQCVLIEQDPAYCDVIRRRIRRADCREPGTLFAGV